MTSCPILSLRGVGVSHGRIEAVRGVSIDVAAGSVLALVGANGAGKTTLLNAVMGVLPSRGEMRFDGRSLGRRSIEERVAAGLCLVPEKRELFATMSVADNLLLGGYGRAPAARRAELERVYALFPRLEERRGQEAGTLSGGERQMLAMGRALMAGPRLLMLDEPSLGLAPLIVGEIFRLIAALRAMGVAILLVEQNARAALSVADEACVMELGAITLRGPAAALAQDPRVVESYLGLDASRSAPDPVRLRENAAVERRG